MYKVIWDIDSNGILLVNISDQSKNIPPPRPVFYEELDLLGFNKYWKYPKVQEPLLWAIGRNYYYKGNLVAEAKGGNLFEPPQITFTPEGETLHLEPIDVDTIISKNKEALFVLENEALDFIEHTYKVFKKKNYSFAVSYSGGKDSQVVLDLVTRIIPPDDLVVVFSDTTMEIAYTYDIVEKTKESYEKKYPGLRFFVARPHRTAIDFWKEFGPPSRIHRWCCTVIKTAPFVRLINSQISHNNKNPMIVVFDGVRADESFQRKQYQRLSQGEKHTFQINAEVIKYWNTSEVFLYIFYRNLKLNKGYRYGLTRIGCAICPFNSQWSEFIHNRIQPEVLHPFLSFLFNEFATNLNLTESKDVYNYIIQGQWKKRAGGEGIDTNGKHLELIKRNDKIIGIMLNPSEDIFEWIKTIGNIFYKKTDGTIWGEIRVKEKTHTFKFTQHKDGKNIFEISAGNDKTSEGKIKRVLYKTTYCVHCGACAVECPTGALEVIPKVRIKNELCTHCGNCLDFIEKGCLVAKSLQIAEGGRNMNKISKIKGFGRYLTFGLREEWLQDFLRDPSSWFENNNLGNKQVESAKTWLLDANLLDRNKQATSLTKILSRIYTRNKDFAWQIIWSNLYYGSSVCRFYIDQVEWNSSYSVKDLAQIVADIDNGLSERTIKSGIGSLLNMFEKSPLGGNLKIGIVEKKGRERFVKKIGTDEVHPLVIAYNLYQLGEHLERRDFTVSELYMREFKGGPYKLFGISRNKLERILRGLQEYKEQIIKVDLIADLDNIFLRDDLSSLDILKIAEGKLG